MGGQQMFLVLPPMISCHVSAVYNPQLCPPAWSDSPVSDTSCHENDYTWGSDWYLDLLDTELFYLQIITEFTVVHYHLIIWYITLVCSFQVLIIGTPLLAWRLSVYLFVADWLENTIPSSSLIVVCMCGCLKLVVVLVIGAWCYLAMDASATFISFQHSVTWASCHSIKFPLK
jgi:hypothetical protein